MAIAVVAILQQYELAPVLIAAGVGETVASIAASAFAMATGAIGGAINTGTLRGAIAGAFQAQAFWGAGTLASLIPNPVAAFAAQIALHAAVGCTSSAIGGGKCGSGAVTSSIALVTGAIAGDAGGSYILRKAVIALGGGTGSALTGGRFGDGAFMAVMGDIFNNDLHSRRSEGGAGDEHNYEIGPTVLCKLSQIGCTMSAAMEEVRKGAVSFAAPPGGLREGENTLLGGNPIDHFVDTANNRIINTTLPGHMFHPGMVVHQLAIGTTREWSWSSFGMREVPAITLTTTGTGTGPYPIVNNVIGHQTFGYTHSWSVQFMRIRMGRGP